MINTTSITENDLEDLFKDIIQLRKYLDYKNRRYCKSFLDEVLEKYFPKIYFKKGLKKR